MLIQPWTKKQLYYLIKTKGKKDNVVAEDIKVTRWGISDGK